MDQGPLVTNLIEEGARFLAEFQKHFSVLVAFWLKESDAKGWNLYIAASDITEDNIDLAYEKVLEVTESIRDPAFDPFQVKLIEADDPLAKEALAIRLRVSGQRVIGYHDLTLGGLSVDWVYIYRLPVPAPAP